MNSNPLSPSFQLIFGMKIFSSKITRIQFDIGIMQYPVKYLKNWGFKEEKFPFRTKKKEKKSKNKQKNHVE